MIKVTYLHNNYIFRLKETNSNSRYLPTVAEKVLINLKRQLEDKLTRYSHAELQVLLDRGAEEADRRRHGGGRLGLRRVERLRRLAGHRPAVRAHALPSRAVF